MTPSEKYTYWHSLVKYDLETAKILLEADRGVYVATFCQQALERLVKGMIIYHTGKEAPKSHNIVFLIDKLSNNKRFEVTELGQRFDEEKDDYMEFFVEVMFYHVSDYPFSYKKVMDRFISKETATMIFEKSLKAIKWLESFQVII